MSRWSHLPAPVRAHVEAFAEFLATPARDRSDDLHARVQTTARAIPGPLHIAALVREWAYRASLSRRQRLTSRLLRRGVDGASAWRAAGVIAGES